MYMKRRAFGRTQSFYNEKNSEQNSILFRLRFEYFGTCRSQSLRVIERVMISRDIHFIVSRTFSFHYLLLFSRVHFISFFAKISLRAPKGLCIIFHCIIPFDIIVVAVKERKWKKSTNYCCAHIQKPSRKFTRIEIQFSVFLKHWHMTKLHLTLWMHFARARICMCVYLSWNFILLQLNDHASKKQIENVTWHFMRSLLFQFSSSLVFAFIFSGRRCCRVTNEKYILIETK